MAIQNEITRLSSATVSVPAAGPYSKTAVNTNASEIEIETFARGNSTETEPLMSVRIASRSHCEPIGALYSCKRDPPMTRNPDTVTAKR